MKNRILPLSLRSPWFRPIAALSQRARRLFETAETDTPRRTVECLEARIAPAAIILGGHDGDHSVFDLGSGDSYVLKASATKLSVFDSAQHLVWSHSALGVENLALDTGGDAFQITGKLRVAGDITVLGGGALTVAGALRAGDEINLDGGFVAVTGSLVAGKSEHGGRIVVTGEKVALLDHANISASGTNGGGTVLIGGDYQGANANVPNAQKVLVEPGVTITADARQHGHGGKIILWADDALQFTGTASAQGGAAGGKGGFVETSSANVQILGAVNVGAKKGANGTWFSESCPGTRLGAYAARKTR